MAEIYVKEMPKSCYICHCFDTSEAMCSITGTYTKFKQGRILEDCPLIDIKDHDRELVKEVCEKIKERAVNMYYAEDQEDDSIEQAIVISRNEAVDEFIDILDQIQKEFEK